MRSTILTAPYAGLKAQALGLAEAAGLAPDIRMLVERKLWRHLPPSLWPAPLRMFPEETLAEPLGDLLICCGGMAAVVGAALRRPGRRILQIQNPRISLSKFDLVMVSRHDEITGPNVIVTRTALHQVTPGRLAEAKGIWTPRLAHLPRPLVAVLVGGGNGRYRLDAPVAEALAASLSDMMRSDDVTVALTPSRRTAAEVTEIFERVLSPLGGYVWRGGDNPYFGLLALADAIVVTQDSISMVSEAVATGAPVMVASLPGRSRRQSLFLRGLIDDGRVRPFAGRLETWDATPINDTDEAAAEMRRRFGF